MSTPADHIYRVGRTNQEGSAELPLETVRSEVGELIRMQVHRMGADGVIGEYIRDKMAEHGLSAIVLETGDDPDKDRLHYTLTYPVDHIQVTGSLGGEFFPRDLLCDGHNYQHIVYIPWVGMVRVKDLGIHQDELVPVLVECLESLCFSLTVVRGEGGGLPYQTSLTWYTVRSTHAYPTVYVWDNLVIMLINLDNSAVPYPHREIHSRMVGMDLSSSYRRPPFLEGLLEIQQEYEKRQEQNMLLNAGSRSMEGGLRD